MKNRFRSSFAFKMLCIVLSLISLSVTVAGLIGSIWFTQIGVWQYSQEETVENALTNYMYQDIYASLYMNGINYSLYVNDSFYRDEKVNFFYELKTQDGEIIGTNITDDSIKTNYSFFVSDVYSSVVSPYEDLLTDDLDWAYKNMNGLISSDVPPSGYEYNGYTEYEVYNIENGVAYFSESVHDIQINAFLSPDLKKGDRYYYTAELIKVLYPYANLIIASTVLSFFLFILFTAIHCAGSAVHSGADGLTLSGSEKFPIDLLSFIFLVLAFVEYILFDWGVSTYSSKIEPIFALTLTAAIFDELLLISYINTFAAKIKTHTFFSSMVTVRFVRFIGRKIKALIDKTVYKFSNLKFVKKTVLSIFAILFFDLIICIITGFKAETAYIMAFTELIIFVPLVISIAVQYRNIELVVKKIVNGDFSFKINTKYMFGDFKRMSEAINGINTSMQKAVDERMKSERFKTELITNVSHDLKTPLTSIINYVDLIKKENVENETVCEYIDVLDRQSSRLKKLIEDLIEASKASTGNIQVNFAPCDAGILLSQAATEYAQRIQNSNLELVVSADERSHYIMADSRLLWRVYDNLLSNICKYTFPGTRVYLSVETLNGRVVTAFKNISKAQLNITSEELMERFVRGDSSRNTEGSGLGLSIVKSLTALQKGDIDISIDGDMFTVSVSFDLIRRIGADSQPNQK